MSDFFLDDRDHLPKFGGLVHLRQLLVLFNLVDSGEESSGLVEGNFLGGFHLLENSVVFD